MKHYFPKFFIFTSLYFCSLTNLHTANLSIEYNPNLKKIILGETTVRFGLDMECGMFDDQALYASFGLEEQVWKCSKVVLPITLEWKKWFGNIELAPLYDSIKHEDVEDIEYGEDSEGRGINGNNRYFDWYKNLGSRTYFADDYPLLNAYIGYRFNEFHNIIAGRLKHYVGLSDNDLPWNDDAKFAPYAHWLSRDLLSGLLYNMNYSLFNFKLGVLSGDNPMKGYANYLGGIQSANTKGNNTPSVSVNLDLHIGKLFSPNNKSKLFIGGIRNKESSTYVAELEDGKRRNSTYVAGTLFNYNISDALHINIYGQYTIYLSGLDEDSNQDDPQNPIFLNIEQEGFYYGADLKYKKLQLSYAYEKFDRFDFNVYEQNGYSTSSALMNLEQESHIYGLNYFFTDAVSFKLAYHDIDNPIEWVSSILDNRDTYRVKATIAVKF